ncbi:MAG: dihydroneopterin aldolase [Chloroflexi bacterium]|nr:dihydroneopterin aldolase [Chloroflexota bacterium]
MSLPNDKIIIKDLRARGILGIHPHEREQAQNLLINIVMFTDIRRAAATDGIEDAVNYETVARRVIAHVEAAANLLTERLATEIADLILTEFAVERVRIRVEKPDILPFASVGVEIERILSDTNVTN